MMWSPFIIVLNVVCGIILIAYIIHGIRRKKRIKEARAAEAAKVELNENKVY